MAGPSRLRTVVEEPTFATEKERISSSVKRLDDVLDGVIWALSRSPHAFEKAGDLDLYLLKTDAAPGIPRLFVWYTFDDLEVQLLFIEAIHS